MIFDRLREPVKRGDLIFVYPSRVGIDAADIWVVSECDEVEGERFPRTECIMVSPGKYSREEEPGFWVLFGPAVYYNPDPNPDLERYSRSLRCLKDVLQPLRSPFIAQREIKVKVNPHGKDVLRYRFMKQCPLCHNETWNAEDSPLFPCLSTNSGAHGADQACPVCMGWKFAFDDLALMDEMEEQKKILGEGSNPQNLSEEEYEKCKKDFLTLVRQRYTVQNERKREMGLKLWDVEDRVTRFRRVFCEGKDVFPTGISDIDDYDDEDEDDYGEEDEEEGEEIEDYYGDGDVDANAEAVPIIMEAD